MQLFARCGSARSLVLSVPEDATTTDLRVALLQKMPKLAKYSDLSITFGGQPCLAALSLRKQGLQDNSTVDVQRRLCGGGGDGGATGAESRVSYLEMYMSKKPDKVDPAEQRLAQWTRCQLSGEPLTPPVVSDELGHLFNKDAVVGALLDKAMPSSLGHISSLRHLIDLKLEPNLAASGVEASGVKVSGNSAGIDNASKFCCPLSGLGLNGRFRFVLMRPSGHVISERALKEIPAAVEDLIGGPWKPADVLPLNGTQDEVVALKQAMFTARAAEKAAKAAKKGSKSKRNASSLPAQVALASDTASAGQDNGHSSDSSKSCFRGVDATNDVSVSPDEQGAETRAVNIKKAAPSNWPKRQIEEQSDTSTASPKRAKASQKVPIGASKSVYASIFTSSSAPQQETYAARSIGARFI